MITPLIHRVLTREDLARLVAEIGRLDRAEARAAAQAVEAGAVDAVLDSPVALDAVRGQGGAPAAVPLPILWYVPVRAALRARGVSDVELADYAATLPVVFTTWRGARRASACGGVTWRRFPTGRWRRPRAPPTWRRWRCGGRGVSPSGSPGARRDGECCEPM